MSTLPKKRQLNVAFSERLKKRTKLKIANFPRKNKISSIRAEILTGGTSSHQFVSFASKFGGNCNLLEQSKIKAFTLAEMLITLVIIGVVAALTIPTVLKNYNDKKYNTARLKALKTFGEAGKMASINGEINGQPDARTFVENVLSKYLKIIKVCDNDKAAECNFPSEIQPLDKNDDKQFSNDLQKWLQIGDNGTLVPDVPKNDAKASIYISTVDGFSAKIFYNGKCKTYTNSGGDGIGATCINVIYDMNGTKAPNHVGEDIGFVTVFWSGINTTASSPWLLPTDMNPTETNRGMYAANVCLQRKTSFLQRLPSIDELSSLKINKKLSSLPSDSGFWSGSLVKGRADYMWSISSDGYGSRGQSNKNWFINIYCVRR